MYARSINRTLHSVSQSQSMGFRFVRWLLPVLVLLHESVLLQLLRVKWKTVYLSSLRGRARLLLKQYLIFIVRAVLGQRRVERVDLEELWVGLIRCLLMADLVMMRVNATRFFLTSLRINHRLTKFKMVSSILISVSFRCLMAFPQFCRRHDV